MASRRWRVVELNAARAIVLTVSPPLRNVALSCTLFPQISYLFRHTIPSWLSVKLLGSRPWFLGGSHVTPEGVFVDEPDAAHLHGVNVALGDQMVDIRARETRQRTGFRDRQDSTIGFDEVTHRLPRGVYDMAVWLPPLYHGLLLS